MLGFAALDEFMAFDADPAAWLNGSVVADDGPGVGVSEPWSDLRKSAILSDSISRDWGSLCRVSISWEICASASAVSRLICVENCGAAGAASRFDDPGCGWDEPREFCGSGCVRPWTRFGLSGAPAAVELAEGGLFTVGAGIEAWLSGSGWAPDVMSGGFVDAGLGANTVEVGVGVWGRFVEFVVGCKT